MGLKSSVRLSSVAMDEAHLMAAVRYVSLNPVRARLAGKAEDWPWSSARAHLAEADDALVSVRPVLDRVERFADLLARDPDDRAFAALRACEGSGRPLGNADFIAGLERLLGRAVARRSPGRKPGATLSAQLDLLA
jgi:putative transposase